LYLCLVYNYENSLWSTNTNQNAISSTNHLSVLYYTKGGSNHIVKKDTSFTEDQDGDAVSYRMRFKTAWIKTAGIIGFQRLWRGTLQGFYEGDHKVFLRIYYNYQETSSENIEFDVLAGDMEIEFLPRFQKCKSIAFEFTFEGDNQNCRVNAIELLVGVKNIKHRISKDSRFHPVVIP